MKKKWILALTAAAFLLTGLHVRAEEQLGEPLLPVEPEVVTETFDGPTQSGAITVQYRTKKEIIDYVNSHGVDVNAPLTFRSNPVTEPPYAMGALSDGTLTSALGMLNTLRYIAGVSDQVVLYEEYNNRCQAGALVNYANGSLSHSPDYPAGMPADIYSLGQQGCGSSDIAWASWQNRSLNSTLLNAWMEDGDDYNISVVGHRRWLLNPDLGRTGFGAVSGSRGTYAQVYVMDHSNTAGREKGVLWPAQNMPVEYFGTNFPWTISLGKRLNGDSISVDLVRERDQKYWYFSMQAANGFFNVDNGGYGQQGCIIFRPEGVDAYRSGDRYYVIIHGAAEEDIAYSVDFFSLSDAVEPEQIQPASVSLSDTALTLKKGDQAVLTATVLPAQAYDRSVTWTSSAPDVVKVKDGVLTCMGPGKAVVTARTVNGLTASCNIVVLMDLDPANPFADVSSSSGWEYPYVKYVYDRGLMTGKGELLPGKVLFDPNKPIARAEFVQILYALEGRPQVEYTGIFSDVPQNQWFTSAVLWAYDRNIVAGKGSYFDVYGVATREELATMFRGYAIYRGLDVSGQADLSGFTDEGTISGWATENLRWAVNEGIMKGKGNMLAPRDKALRSECAAMLKGFLEKNHW